MSFEILALFAIILIAIYIYAYNKLRDKIFSKLLKRHGPVQKIIYKGRNFEITLKRAGEKWSIIGEKVYEANIVKVRKLILKLNGLDIVDRQKEKKDGEFDLGKNGEIELYYTKSNDKLIFGKTNPEGDLVYIKKSNERGVFLVNSTILSLLPKSIENFRNLILYNLYYEQVKTVDILIEGTGYIFIKGITEWKLNGKPIEEEDAKYFINYLTSLEADSVAPLDTKLPAKHNGFIQLKTRTRSITKYFFKHNAEYYIPANREILVISQEALYKAFTCQYKKPLEEESEKQENSN